MVYGNDESRTRWYNEDQLKNKSLHIINRNDLPISATEARYKMAINDQTAWETVSPECIHYLYDALRKELMKIDFYQKIYNDYCKTL